MNGLARTDSMLAYVQRGGFMASVLAYGQRGSRCKPMLSRGRHQDRQRDNGTDKAMLWRYKTSEYKGKGKCTWSYIAP